jgi:hypothetical protein
MTTTPETTGSDAETPAVAWTSRPLPEWDETKSPWSDPVTYLLSRNWRFSGDPSTAGASLWYSPRSPRPGITKFKKPVVGVIDRTGRQILESDPSDPSGRRKIAVPFVIYEVEQTLITPGPVGVSLHEALLDEIDHQWSRTPTERARVAQLAAAAEAQRQQEAELKRAELAAFQAKKKQEMEEAAAKRDAAEMEALSRQERQQLSDALARQISPLRP